MKRVGLVSEVWEVSVSESSVYSVAAIELYDSL